MAFFVALARTFLLTNGMTNLDETIRENAAGPAKASGDAGSMEQHKLPDQIAADKYLASKDATTGRRFPLRFARVRPPGAS